MNHKLYVFIGREQVGCLGFNSSTDEFSFEYHQQWLKSGFEISPNIPFSGCVSKGVRRFLMNLLPEGHWLEDLSITSQISKSNIFGLTKAIGKETTGALLFTSEPNANMHETSFRQVTEAELSQRINARQSQSIVVWDGKQRLSVAGVQEKLPILIKDNGEMGFGEGELASTHIIKFGNDKDLHIVLNEYICMSLAKSVGLNVADVELKQFGEPVLIVKRFDRQLVGAQVKRTHIIDGCQLLNLPPSHKYERNFGSGRDVKDIRDGVSLMHLFQANGLFKVPAKAKQQMLNWLLFNLLIENSDAHGKNISFFITRSGLEVAPAYDLVNIPIYQREALDTDLAMAIGDEFKLENIDPYQLAEMCEVCDLPKTLVSRSLQRMITSLLKVIGEFNLEALKFDNQQIEFSSHLLERIKQNALRFLEVAKELPSVKL